MRKRMVIAMILSAVLACATAAQAWTSPGDMNCDLLTDGHDVAAFVLALLAPSAYEASHPSCELLSASLNCDVDVDLDDIPLFVDCLLRGNCGSCLVVETVAVGNPGNAGDPQLDGLFGSVVYEFYIGKNEVTAGQYAQFLNAVAATDTYALYNPSMSTHEQGCKIERTGSSGSYTYSVAPDWANRPVNFVSFGDAMRFANWLHNEQPTGDQDLTTTEDGSYFLNGMVTDDELDDVFRESDASWVVPSEDEWYKAAYHANDGATGNYFNYPMSVDFGISNDLTDPDPGGHATYYSHPNDFTIGAPYYRTEVGAHDNSASPYGTFDQGGNVVEWNESIPLFNGRGLRGGAFLWGSDLLGAWSRPIEYHSSDEFSDIGFRVARLP